MRKLSLVPVAAALVLAGCREERPPEPPAMEMPAQEEPTEAPPAAPEEEEEEEPMARLDPEVTSFLLEIDSEIVRRCEGLDAQRMVFHRDAERTDPEHRENLERLAQCVGTGDLAGERIAIIGFADRRGRHDFDFERGGERAQSVAEYLDREGVDRERMATMAMGEVFATPEDRETFGFERRVTIRLADEDPTDVRPPPPTATGRG
jgi:outer membrane protein OmpA-like peptidoglycan-associated protein